MRKKHKIKLLTLGFAITIFSSCSSLKDLPSTNALTRSTCYNKADYDYTTEELPNDLFPNDIDSVLSVNFSFDALNVANALGVFQPLKEYVLLKEKYKTDSSLENRLKILELRTDIIEKINIASLEISAVTSELDCEEERADQIANYLKTKANQREKNLVISSIIFGAASAITVEGLNNSSNTGKTGSYVAVGSALVGTTLGVLMLIDKKTVDFLHERNTIGEIWNNILVSKTLPPSIWYYLNYKNDFDKKQSLNELLIEHWKMYGQVEEKRKKDKGKSDIYFGSGGKYSSDELKNRAQMYDQIEAYIKLMKQDLKVLSTEFEKL